MSRTDSLVRYYSRRAGEYDSIYEKPERQEDLGRLRTLVRDWTSGHRVLELACGTGWWTREIARSAVSVTATDASAEVLDRARRQDFGDASVEFRTADARRPHWIEGRFTAVVAGFWVSHLERSTELPAFLDAVGLRLGPGGVVILFDNRFVEGSSTPVSRVDDDGNTYQERRLASGEEFEVLKNFLGQAELERHLAPRAEEHEVVCLPHFWVSRHVIRERLVTGLRAPGEPG